MPPERKEVGALRAVSADIGDDGPRTPADVNLFDDEELKAIRERVATALEKGGNLRALNDRTPPSSEEIHDEFVLHMMNGTQPDVALCKAGVKTVAGKKKRRKKTAEQTAETVKRCGLFPAMLVVNGTDIKDWIRAQCRCPLCPICAKFKASNARDNLIEVVESLAKLHHKFSLITVTIPHAAADSLIFLCKALFDSVRIFTRCSQFRDLVHGYARGVETTFGKNGFHVHAHFTADAQFWPKADMKRAWVKAVKTACGRVAGLNGLHVRGVPNVRECLNEAIGYPFKAADLKNYSDVQIVDLWRVFKGRHLLQMCKSWGELAAKIAQSRRDDAERLAASEGDERIRFVHLAQGIKNHESRACEIGEALLDRLVNEGYEEAAELVGFLLRPGFDPSGGFGFGDESQAA